MMSAMSDDANYQQVLDQLRAVLVEALGVDEEEVTPDATLRDDLGAESIDFLDLVFQLQQAFGIEIKEGEMLAQDVLDDPACVQNGKLTDEGLGRLRARLPHADLTPLEADRDVDVLGRVYTVDTLVRFVQRKLD